MKKIIIFGFIIVILITGFLLMQQFNSNEVIEINKKVETKFIPSEDITQAKARQIITLYEKVSFDNLQDLKSEGLCDISVNNDEIVSNDKVSATINFDESLEGEMVNLWCDQFERFGISGDIPYAQLVGSDFKLELDECDYGKVTVPTVYFLFATSLDDIIDYCVYPITVLPQEEDIGVCHNEETIEMMKKACLDSVGNEGYTIPDSNGCETVYCGWGGTKCPSESLLNRAENECTAVGNTPSRYSYDVDGQDWPCADIRCSVCPSEEDLEFERVSCIEKGGEPSTEPDFETGCSFIYCGSNSEEIDENEVGNEELEPPA